MDSLPSILYKTLEKLTELTSVGVVIVNQQNEIVFANDYFAHNLCKSDKKNLINKKITQNTEIPTQIQKIITFRDESLLDSTVVTQFTTDIVLWDTVKVTFRVLKMGFIDGNNRFVITLLINISDQVEIYKTLKQSDIKYRYLLNTVPMGLLVIDARTLQIREVNKSALIMFGYDESTQLAGKNLREIITLDDEKIFNAAIAKWENSSSHQCKITINNSEKYLKFSFIAITLDDEQCYIITVDDITPLKKAQEEITISHSQVKHLLSAIDSILIGVSRDDVITHWNRTAAKIFGISQDVAVGKKIIGFDIPWEWDKIYIGITNSLAEKRPITLPDVRYESLYGQKRLLGITVNPIMDETGNLLGYLLFGRDITDKRISESEILQAQKLQSIGQLAAGIAHEINTPAQYVNDNLHFIKDVVKDLENLMIHCDDLLSLLMNAKQLPQKLKEMLDTIKTIKQTIDYDYCKTELPKAIDQSIEGISKIVGIVKSLKSFAHPDTQKKISINIHTLLQDVITITRNEWKYIADITTHFKQIDIVIPCFPNQLSQVFLNMIINSRDAIQEAIDKKLIERGHIEMFTDMDSEYAIVSIKDNGIGIKEELMPKIFDPFFTTKEVGKGTGQGLAIAHSIIYDKHKGKIRVESEYAKGTTFKVYLPLRETLGEV